MSADAYHMTAPNTDGPKRSMLNALRNAGLNRGSSAVRQCARYLHAARRQERDRCDQAGVRRCTPSKLVVNSTKSMTGHLLGGAGGMESVFMRVGGAPPDFAADDQYLRAGSGVRSGLLRQYCTRHEDRCRGEQQLRFWWYQRHAGVPPRLTSPAPPRMRVAPPVQARSCSAGLWLSLQQTLYALTGAVFAYWVGCHLVGDGPWVPWPACHSGWAAPPGRREVWPGRHGNSSGTARPGRCI